MPISVEVKDVGVIEFPDNTNPETIHSALQRKFGKQAQKQQVEQKSASLPLQAQSENIPSMQATPEESVGRKTWRTIREGLTPLLGPSEEQVQREGVLVDGKRVYKPLGDKIEQKGMVKAAIETGSKPLVELPRAKEKADDTTSKSLAKAAYNVAAGFAEGAETPLGMATGGAMGAGGKLATVAKGALGADMASNLPEAVQRAKQAHSGGSTQEKAEAYMGLAAQSMIAPALLGKATHEAIQKERPMVPALKTSEGEILQGKLGQHHDDIPTTDKNAERGFYTNKGNFVSREQAAKMLGQTEPLHSEKLNEINAKQVSEKIELGKLRQEWAESVLKEHAKDAKTVSPDKVLAASTFDLANKMQAGAVDQATWQAEFSKLGEGASNYADVVWKEASRIAEKAKKPDGLTVIDRLTNESNPEESLLFSKQFKNKTQNATLEKVATEGSPNAPRFVIPSVVSQTLQRSKEAIQTAMADLSNKSLPRITSLDRATGEAGVRMAAAREASIPLAQVYTSHVLEGTGVDPIKFGAALTEDNLRSVRDGLLKEDDVDGALNVGTLVGKQGSPFKTEAQFKAFLEEPGTKLALERHKQQWEDTIEPMYRNAMEIDPETELPSRGQATGARINLFNRLVSEEAQTQEPMAKPIGASLTATFKKKSPFGRQAKGTGENYETDYNRIMENTFQKQLHIAEQNRFVKKMVESGLAEIHPPGKVVTLRGQRAVSFPLQHKVTVINEDGVTKTYAQNSNLYVDPKVATEFRSAMNVDPPTRYMITPVANVLNRASLAGLAEFTTHVSNLATAMFNNPTSGKLFADTLLSATGRADVPIALVKAILKASKNNSEQLTELASIGATKPRYSVPGDQNWKGKILNKMDHTTRLLLDDTYQSLVKEGILDASETSRREFINQVGQYNRRLQGPFTKMLRDSGIGPFATAGKTFNAMGIRMATLTPAVEAASNYGAMALKMNALMKWTGMAVQVGILNYLFTRNLPNGGVTGRPGTALGQIDLGIDDEKGRPLTFPLADVIGLGRAMRVTGVGKAIDTERLGLSDGDAMESASKAILNAAMAPAEGPMVQFGSLAATGKPAALGMKQVSEPVPPGGWQMGENLKTAILEANPLVKAVHEEIQGKPDLEVLRNQFRRFSPMTGHTPQEVESLPQRVRRAQARERKMWEKKQMRER